MVPRYRIGRENKEADIGRGCCTFLGLEVSDQLSSLCEGATPVRMKTFTRIYICFRTVNSASKCRSGGTKELFFFFKYCVGRGRVPR